MEKKELKKLLAGIGIAGLLAGSGLSLAPPEALGASG